MIDEPLSLATATARLTAPGQVFELEDRVVGDVAMTVWKNAPSSLRDILEMTRRYGEREFLVYGDERVTFEAHYRRVATLTHRLHDLGVRVGDRVAISARNLPDWVCAYWGIVTMGAIAVPLNAWWTADELRYGLADSGARVLFVDEERLERVRALFDELVDVERVIVLRSSGLDEPVADEHDRVRVVALDDLIGTVELDAEPIDASLDPDDDATIFYTSGTTGRPKGAVATHRNIVTNLMNLFFISQRSSLRFGEGPPDATRYPNANLLNIPLFHATGCLAVMVVNAAAGGRLVMMHHFDAGQALALIERERITAIGGVPTVVMQILDHPDFQRFDTSSVRLVSYGGAPAPP
ncbi:MAG: hypothetical protein B7X10_02065, partial [Burkholderiales bacterium 21-58-4]